MDEKLSVTLSISAILYHIESVLGLQFSRGISLSESDEEPPDSGGALCVFRLLNQKPIKKVSTTAAKRPAPAEEKTRLRSSPAAAAGINGRPKMQESAPVLSGPNSFTIPAAYRMV